MEKSYYLMVSLQLHRMLVVCPYGIGDRGYKVLVSGCMQSCKIQMGENFIFTINITYNGAMMNAFLVDKDSLQVMFLHLADVRHLDMFAVCNEKEFIKRVLLGD